MARKNSKRVIRAIGTMYGENRGFAFRKLNESPQKCAGDAGASEK